VLEFKNFIIINDLIPRHDVMLPLGLTLFAPNQTSSKRRNSHQCHISDFGWELLQTNIHQNVIENLTIKIKFNQYCPKTTGNPPKNGDLGGPIPKKCIFRRWMFSKRECFRVCGDDAFHTFQFRNRGYWTWSFSLNPLQSSLDQMILFLVWVKEATKYTSSQGQVKNLKSNL